MKYKKTFKFLCNFKQGVNKAKNKNTYFETFEIVYQNYSLFGLKKLKENEQIKSDNSTVDTNVRNQILRKIEEEGKANQTKSRHYFFRHFFLYIYQENISPAPLCLFVCFQIKIRRAFSEIGRKDKIGKRFSGLDGVNAQQRVSLVWSSRD